MAQKKHKPEEIVAKLRQVDVLLSQGRPVAEAIRTIGVTAFTYYRWRKEFGGLKSDQVKRLKDLEKENERLRKAVARFVENARIVSPAAKTRQPSPADARHTREELAEIRAWARQAGWSISDRGRIPVEVQRAFAEASEVRSVRKRRR